MFKQKLWIWILKQKRNGLLAISLGQGIGFGVDWKITLYSSLFLLVLPSLHWRYISSPMSRLLPLLPYLGLCLLILSDFPSPQIFYEEASTSQTVKSRNLGEDLATRTRPTAPSLACLHTSFTNNRERQKHTIAVPLDSRSRRSVIVPVASKWSASRPRFRHVTQNAPGNRWCVHSAAHQP